MLTATYSFVALSAEHDNVHSMLCGLQQYIQTAWKGLHKIDLAFLENAFSKLMQFDKYFHVRKIEIYVIPVLRRTTREADGLIAELEFLSAKGMGILRSVGEQLGMALDMGSVKVNEICHSMDLYCHHLMTRLTKEQEQLLPMARRLISMEDWFAIAAQFLSDDAEVYGRKRHAVVPPRPIAHPAAPVPRMLKAS